MKEPAFRTDMGVIYQGHVLSVLKTLPDESVQCCVTSPPYWGLRDYKLEPQIWDAVEGCDHEWGEDIKGKSQSGSLNGSTLDGAHPGIERRPEWTSAFCLRCGAWRGSLGLEPSHEMFCRHIVQVFREIRRVLRKDGTVWCNLGDSYAGSWGNYHPTGKGGQRPKATYRFQREALGDKSFKPPTADCPNGLKPKDLVGIPWMVAFALRNDGWWLRIDIIWSKPNQMPESVTDRPTKAHEYIFLLTKSQKYFFDQKAVRENSVTQDPRKPYCPGQVDNRWNGHDRGGGKIRPVLAQGKWSPEDENASGKRMTNNVSLARAKGAPHDTPFGLSRNLRSVWTITTRGFPEAHFATFPEAIPEKCIKAGSKVGDTILDPFFGAGTVGLVAEKLYRRWVGIELNPDYVEMAKKRIKVNANVNQANWLKGGGEWPSMKSK